MPCCGQGPVGDEPFAVRWAMVLIPGEIRDQATDRCLRSYRRGAIAVEEVPKEKTHLYVSWTPACSANRRSARGCCASKDLVEKPKPEAAPSNLAITGRYVFAAGVLRLPGADQARRGQ